MRRFSLSPWLPSTRGLLPAAFALGALACGYHTARTVGRDVSGPWCVTSGPEPSPFPQAVGALERGARDALARDGSLAPCGRTGEVVVEILDVQFAPVGILAPEEIPTARGSRVRVTATAYVSSGGQRRDLGMVTGEQVVASGSTAMGEQQARSAGVMAAARRAGRSLVRRLLGEPAPSIAP